MAEVVRVQPLRVAEWSGTACCSERSGRTSVEGHARAAERRALVRVLADAVQAQLGGQLSGRGELTFGGHSATPSKLDHKRVADAVLLWTTTPSRDAGSDG